MDLSVHEGEIPMPITSTYVGSHVPPVHTHGHGHGHGHSHVIHNHIIPSPSPPLLPSNGPPIAPNLVVDDSPVPYSKKNVVTKYRECLKNHAASMGGNATDGCGEFMPSGEEGTIESLKCSACNCHRNFHRKDTEGESSSCECYHQHQQLVNTTRKVVGQKGVLITGSEALGYMPRPLPHHMIMSYNMGMPSESDEQENGGAMGRGGGACLVKKRFRTKFTQEQKEKMLGFAEKVGWRLQKQEEGVVQQFCQEIGVKRRVLKVWMHNNKHNLAKKSNSS